MNLAAILMNLLIGRLAMDKPDKAHGTIHGSHIMLPPPPLQANG